MGAVYDEDKGRYARTGPVADSVAAASVAALETKVNELLAALRDAAVIASD